MRFAVACGLHHRPYLPSLTTIAKMRDLGQIGGGEDGISAIDLPDTDAILTDEPNAMWYAIYMTDAAISAGTGLPSSLPNDVSLGSMDSFLLFADGYLSYRALRHSRLFTHHSRYRYVLTSWIKCSYSLIFAWIDTWTLRQRIVVQRKGHLFVLKEPRILTRFRR